MLTSMAQEVTLENVRHALTLSDFDVLAAHQIMAPLARGRKRPPQREGIPRIGGVLLLLYCVRDDLHVVLTRRRENLNAHAGQISFPGGRQELEEPLVATALRETYEEVGVPETAVTILGRLSKIYIPPSDFEVHPFVGWYQNGRPQFSPGTNEVAEILEVPLTHLLKPSTRQEEPWDFRGVSITVPFFNVNGHKVWGATAIMLSEFLERLRIVMTV